MAITEARYQADGSIVATIDGALMTVPDDAANRHRAELAAWEADGNAIAAYVPPPPPRRLVPKSLIIARLNEAGLLSAASAALNADLYTRERWYAPDRPAIYADDAEALALIAAIAGDPAVILAD